MNTNKITAVIYTVIYKTLAVTLMVLLQAWLLMVVWGMFVSNASLDLPSFGYYESVGICGMFLILNSVRMIIEAK